MKKSFKQLCLENEIKYNSAINFRKRHPELNDKQIIKHYLSPKKKYIRRCLTPEATILKNLCKQYNVDYHNVYSYKHRHPELTNKQVIYRFLNPTQTLKDICKQYNINILTLYKYKERHPELTDEQLIQYYLMKKPKLSFSSLCKQYNINYNITKSYKRDHPELSDIQVIQYYLPNSYINTQGELIVI